VNSHSGSQSRGIEVDGGWWTEPLFPVDQVLSEPEPGPDSPSGRLLAAVRPEAGQRWHWLELPAGSELDPFELTVTVGQRTPPGLVGVTMKFGRFLVELRRARDLIPGRAELWTARPPERDGQVALPHLTTTIDRAGRTGDHVVWESLGRDRFEQWLAGADPTVLEWVVSHLAELKALRARARTGQLGHTPDERRLLEVVDNRFLSVRAVCQHAELIERLVRSPGLRAGIRPGAAGPAPG
jgi:hypothetical protein